MKLAPGLYEQLVTLEMDPLVRDPSRVPALDPLHADAAPELLARHVYEAARRALSALTGADRVAAQLALTNLLLQHPSDAAEPVLNHLGRCP